MILSNFLDIILTTLKPQLKNVTAADVASSLYYFHLNTEDDVRFMEEQNQPASVEETVASKDKPLSRKPLPGPAKSSPDVNPQMTSLSISPGGILGVPRRKPASSEPGLEVSKQQPGPGKQNLSRKPLGPRPLLPEPKIEKDIFPGVENQPWASTARSEQVASALGARNEASERPPSPDIATSKIEAGSDKTFSITLIRRDPSSGAQWNIGSIFGHAANETRHQGTNARRKPQKESFDILVQLSAPGYSPFRVPEPTNNAKSGLAAVPSTSAENLNPDQADAPAMPCWSFDRHIRMEGSRFWSRPSIQHRRTLSDFSGKHITTRGRSSSGSSDGGRADTPLGNDDEGLDLSDSQSKGYTFVSPWGGRCKFSTGSSGRKLRCKHTLPVPVSASNNNESTSSQHVSAPVSELRFNLPSAALFSPSTRDSVSKKGGLNAPRLSASKFSNLRKKLSPNKTSPSIPPRPHPTSYAAMYPSDDEEAPPLPPRSYHTTDSSDEEAPPPLPARLHPYPYSVNAPHEETIDDDPHLDLSIGQERAGGGNRGKRAKLGKLVIHHEGFKMLDLVVAANIGVWWSVWESVSI
jgi:hypothetical protein